MPNASKPSLSRCRGSRCICCRIFVLFKGAVRKKMGEAFRNLGKNDEKSPESRDGENDSPWGFEHSGNGICACISDGRHEADFASGGPDSRIFCMARLPGDFNPGQRSV